ncbi:hypothetical protein EVAR_52769_1 [Eumeta japonica]|uniref:Uncharacterized protein n=1 Tax=Eumeta variegata TaxID=151549 RepID=A0A4C1XDU8_EUMVA|nr:hypothetical protein EVAR_52769_1 [Eumeta japonica]
MLLVPLNFRTYHDVINGYFSVVARPSVSFMTPSMVIERHAGDHRTRSVPAAHATACHYTGSVRGQPASRVALSACDGLICIIMMASAVGPHRSIKITSHRAALGIEGARVYFHVISKSRSNNHKRQPMRRTVHDAITERRRDAGGCAGAGRGRDEAAPLKTDVAQQRRTVNGRRKVIDASQADRLGRSCGSIACSALSLARSTQAERDNESCFFPGKLSSARRAHETYRIVESRTSYDPSTRLHRAAGTGPSPTAAKPPPVRRLRAAHAAVVKLLSRSGPARVCWADVRIEWARKLEFVVLNENGHSAAEMPILSLCRCTSKTYQVNDRCTTNGQLTISHPDHREEYVDPDQ